MKHFFLLISLWGGLTCSSYAQSPSEKVPKDSSALKAAIVSLTQSEVNSLLPQITPKSPNVSSLEKFGDYPVAMYTGLPSIEIPLYEITVGNTVIPIKLAYHAGGNKVNDNASWVGLGFTLVGDFAIMRNVRGKPDEEDFINNNSLLQHDLPVLSQINGCLTRQLKSDLNLYASRGKDIERDIFTYHTPNKTNSFIITPNQGTIWQEPDKSIFSYSGAFQNPTITDENGTTYVYARPETTNSFLSGRGITSAWHLTSIQGVKETDKVSFSYESNAATALTGEIADTEIYHTDISGSEASTITGGFIESIQSNDSPTVTTQLLSQITFPMGKVVFVPSSNDRPDFGGKSLDAVEVYLFNVVTNQYDLTKKYTFSYIYQQRLNSYAGDVVMFLDKVNLVANDNTILGSYSFNYNTQALPSKQSKARDYWNYYNGQTQNTTLIPPFTFSAKVYSNPSTIFQGGGANREVNESMSKAWVLEKITYPTGGFTNFNYESNRYEDNSGQQKLAGGLRIAQIISDDGMGNTTTKSYKYGIGESGNGTLRSMAYKNYSTQQKMKLYPVDSKSPNYIYTIRTFASTLTRSINTNEGTPVTYPVVTEYQENNTASNGKTIYTFKDDSFDDLISIPSNGNSAQRNRYWNRGQLLSKVIYGSDGLKKYEQINTYQPIVSGVSPVIGYLIGKSETRLVNELFNSTSGCYEDDDNFDPINAITWNYGLVKQISTIENVYDNQDESLFTTKKVETDYSTSHFQPTLIKEYVANSILLNKLRWYPQDFTSIPSNAPVSAEVYALKRMQERNMLTTVIEEVDYRQDLLAPTSPIIITGGHFNTFDVTSTASGTANETAIVPKSTDLLECVWNTFLGADNSITYMASRDLFNPSVNTTTIPRNANYKTRVFFDQYDNQGYLKRFHQSDGASTSYSYQYSANDNIPFAYPTSQTQNSTGSKQLTSYFGFNVPLLGLSYSIDPAGIKTSFEYDTFGRLLLLKDHYGNILKKYQYKY